MGIYPHFRGFWLKLLRFWKIQIEGDFSQNPTFWGFWSPDPGKTPKMGIFGKSGPAGVSFTSTPRGGAPRFPGRVPREGLVSRPPPGPGLAAQAGEPREVPGTGLRDPGNRGAPARGVDVKPPRGPGSGTPIGAPGDPAAAASPPGRGPLPGSGDQAPSGPGGLGTPGSGRPRSRDLRSGDPEKGSPAPGGGARRGCFTSTSRAGAPRFPGVSESHERPGSQASTAARPEGSSMV